MKFKEYLEEANKLANDRYLFTGIKLEEIT